MSRDDQGLLPAVTAPACPFPNLDENTACCSSGSSDCSSTSGCCTTIHECIDLIQAAWQRSSKPEVAGTSLLPAQTFLLETLQQFVPRTWQFSMAIGLQLRWCSVECAALRKTWSMPAKDEEAQFQDVCMLPSLSVRNHASPFSQAFSEAPGTTQYPCLAAAATAATGCWQRSNAGAGQAV